MPEDRRLSEFGIDDESEAAGSEPATVETPRHPDSTDETSGERQGQSPSTSLATYAWGVYTCSSCQSDVTRLWRDDDAFVCEGCKGW